MSAPTLVVIGSGPGIALAFTKLFAQRKFSKIALLSRSSMRLEDDKKAILESVPGKELDIKCWGVDIAKKDIFEKVLAEVSDFGDVSCVLFNAARVVTSEISKFPGDEIITDFTITTVALYTTACWAIPILNKKSVEEKPSLLITSSLLWKDPYPEYFSLSLSKASQRNLAQSLVATYPDVHIALLNVAGHVSPEHKYLNPPAIAQKFWDLYQQEKKDWTLDLEVSEGP
ncbi:hypothetical protein ACHAP3_000731 [Botrytis cinerea]